MTCSRKHVRRCPYCQKVWLLLEEKRIPYTIEKVNMRCYGAKPDSFLRKVPAGLLPVIEIDGNLITESDDIMAALEATFPERPMMPPRDSESGQRAQALLRLERQHFSAWLQWLCSPRGHEQARQAYEGVVHQVAAALDASEVRAGHCCAAPHSQQACKVSSLAFGLVAALECQSMPPFLLWHAGFLASS